VTKIDDDIQQIFNIVIGQCSHAMEQALVSMNDFKTMKEEADSIILLN